MLLYLIWFFLIGSIVLMIGVMIYNEWYAPMPVDSVELAADAGAGTMALESSGAAPVSSFAESAPASRRKAAPRRKPAAKKSAGRTAAKRR